jgi:8-oxo-dGTP diphosphatase
MQKTVVAALICREGKVLVCQRRRNDTFGLQWEFPGGKVELGETPIDALERELREELGVDATIGDELYRTRHHYGEIPTELSLIFFKASVHEESLLENFAFERFEWADPTDLLQYKFLAADTELIALLVRREILLG